MPLRPFLPVAALVLAVSAALPVLAPASGPARALEPISVVIDRAKVMRISAPAATVIVGNPAIADATVYDRQTIVITGKMSGTTNLVILDQAGQPIADEILLVEPPSDTLVTVQRGAGGGRYTYSCTPVCTATVAPGDTNAFFNETNTQITTRSNLGAQSAGAGAQ